ncbi:MAG: VacJ family lipoprotein [Desulfobacula sp.]|nr:VacJ family lipoprotein [Desulfobacula sp.]
MKKNYFFLIFITALFFFVNINVYAQGGNQGVKPIISEQFSYDFHGKLGTGQNKNFLLALNDNSTVPEDDMDEEFEDDFLDDSKNPEQSQKLADPLYYYNYFMYTFNDVFYTAVLKPVTCAYKALTPSCLRKGVDNFFGNLLFPVRLVNNLLQGKTKEAGTEVKIFLINSTIGVAGFGQVAQSRFNLNTSKEDFRQTLGSWSIDNGFYLVLPLAGPSTLRDCFGRAGDYFLTPVNYIESTELYYGLWSLDLVNSTSFRLGDYESLKKAALDPYQALKDAYIQNMNEKIRR